MEIPLAVRRAFDNDTYVLEVAMPLRESGSTGVIAAAGSDNTVKVYSQDDLKLKTQLKGPTNTITGLQFAPDNSNIIYSSSMDGLVWSWDVRSSKIVQRYGDQETHKFCSFSVNCDGSMIAAGTEAVETDSYIVFWDIRNTEPVAKFEDSHSDDITQTQFHSLNHQLLSTGSMDGLVCIFDISSMTEEDAIISVLNSESSVSKIGFFGSEHQFIFCMTHTESFCSWNATEGDLIASHTDMRQQLKSQCNVDINYLIDCFCGGADRNDNSLSIAAGGHNGAISLLSTDKCDKFQLTGKLAGGHSSTARCICTDPHSGMIVTGGEDGLVCVWCPVPADSEASKQLPSDSLKAPSSVKRKRKREKPY